LISKNYEDIEERIKKERRKKKRRMKKKKQQLQDVVAHICNPVIPAFQRLRKEDQGFKARR
jgi:hypothetical protein